MIPLLRRAAALAVAVRLLGGQASGQATGSGDGSKTGDGSTPFTGLSQAPEANLFLGSAATSVPFLLPPGRHSMTPQLGLNYSSGSGPSAYGHGWELSLPRLQRTTKYGVLNCSDTAVRNELVLALPGTSIECTLSGEVCKPHVESGFIRIKRTSVDANVLSFTVTDKSGIQYTFGGTQAVTTNWTTAANAPKTSFASTEYAVMGSSTTNNFDAGSVPCRYVSEWMLTEIRDPNGNTAEYRYVRDGGVLYPHSVVYGGNDNGASAHTHPYAVQFLWQTRSDTPADAPNTAVSDPVVNALGGFPAVTNYRLRRANVLYTPPGGTAELVRGYGAIYETARRGRQTFLKAVSLIGNNGNVLTRNDGANTPASTMFVYQPPDVAGFEATAQTRTRPPALIYKPGRLRISENSGTRRDVMDMNGDGFPDLVDAKVGNDCTDTSTGPRYWNVFFGSKEGFAATPTAWYLPPTAQVPACNIAGVMYDSTPEFRTRFTTVDITGDGVPDFIDSQNVVSGAFRYWKVYPGTAYSPFGPAGSWGFGNYVEWSFASGEGVERDYVRRLARDIDVSDLAGYTGEASILYQDLLDLNGDGLLDLVRTCGTSCDFSTNWEVYFNRGNGTGFRPREFFTGHFKALTVTTEPPDAPGTVYTVADVNGDGLPDQLSGKWIGSSLADRYMVYLNTGRAMDGGTAWPVVPLNSGAVIRQNYSQPQDAIRDFIDVNGDGLPDVVDRLGWAANTNQNWRVFLNRGSSFEQVAMPWSAPRNLIREAGEAGEATTYDTFDIDGDGMVDFVDFFNSAGSNPDANYKLYRASNGAWQLSGTTVVERPGGMRPDLLVTVDSAVGARTRLAYRPSTQWDNNGSDVASDPVDLPFNLWTVTRICHDDSRGIGSCDAPVDGHQTGMTVLYENGRFDPVERELRGFGRVTATAIGGGGAPPAGTFTAYNQTAALSGKVDLAITYDASGGGNLLTKPILSTKNFWECFDLPAGNVVTCPQYPGMPAGNPLVPLPVVPAGSIWVRLKQVEEKTYTNFTTANKVVETVNKSWHFCGTTTYGNVKEAYRGRGGDASSRINTETAYDCSNQGAYIVDRPTSLKVMGATPTTVLEETWFAYDARGNRLSEEAWIDQGDLGLADNCTHKSGAKCAVTTTTYDGRGMPVSEADANDNVTTITYGVEPYLYPSTITAPLGHKISMTYDLKCGAPESETVRYVGSTVPGLNDRLRFTYDPFCRRETVYRPGENPAVVAIPYRRYEYKLGAPQPFVPTATLTYSREPNNTGVGYIRSAVLGDGLGRPIEEKVESVVDGTLQVVVTPIIHNSFGGIWQRGAPQVQSTSVSFAAVTATTSTRNATTLYDAVGRPVRLTHPDDKFRTMEVGVAWETTVKDECFHDAGCVGTRTVDAYDAFGRVIDSKQFNDSGTALSATRSTYDALGRLTTITQGDGSSWNTNSTITNVYDSLGRLVSRTDPDTGPGGASPAAGIRRFGYDPNGNLRYEDDPIANQHLQFCYDAQDRPTKKKYLRTAYSGLQSCTTNASEQITSYYDAAINGLGRMHRVTDLSGETSIAEYSPLGQVKQVTRSMAGVNAQTIYAYDAADHVQGLQYPDGEIVGYQYDRSGQVSAVLNGSGGPVYAQGLTYDAFGRPRTVPHGNGVTDIRTYDTTGVQNYRLSEIRAEAGATVHLRYAYTAYQASGRLTQISDTTPAGSFPGKSSATATYSYDGLGRLLTAVHAAGSGGTLSYGYHTLGNITAIEGTTLTYAAAKPHQPTQASGAQAATFLYDDNGNRTSNTVSSGALVYRYDLDDRVRLIKQGSGGVEFAYDAAGQKTIEWRGPLTGTAPNEQVNRGLAEVTYHYTDVLEVTGASLRKYYVAGPLLIASRDTTAPAPLQVVSAGDAGAVQVAGRVLGGQAVLTVALQPAAARAAALLVVLTGVALLVPIGGRRRPAVVGIRVRPVEATLLAVVVAVGTLPWPLVIAPAWAGGGGPGPTPTPVAPVQIHHYHLDHLGSPNLVTSGTGGVVKHQRYRPYGEVRPDDSNFTVQDDREFTGYEKEPLSGHYYAAARFYDPNFALFLTHDPARQFASPYTYTNWNPIGLTDPSGMQAVLLGVEGVLGVPQATSEVGAATNSATAGEGVTGSIGSTGGTVEPKASDDVIRSTFRDGKYYLEVSNSPDPPPKAFNDGRALGLDQGANPRAATDGSLSGYLAGSGNDVVPDAPGGPVQLPEAVVAGTRAQGLRSPPLDPVDILSGLAAGAVIGGMIRGATTGAAATLSRTEAIDITAAGLRHTIRRHTVGGLESAGKSVFSDPGGVAGLIRGAGSVAPVPQPKGYFARIVDARQLIGINRVTGLPTSQYTVITDSAGRLITAYPGVP